MSERDELRKVWCENLDFISNNDCLVTDELAKEVICCAIDEAYDLGRKSRGVDWNELNDELELNNKLDAIGSEGSKLTFEESQLANGDLP